MGEPALADPVDGVVVLGELPEPQLFVVDPARFPPPPPSRFPVVRIHGWVAVSVMLLWVAALSVIAVQAVLGS
jgi:hypothetical protein